MKILHIIQNLNVGGGQRALYNLVTCLKQDKHIILTYAISDEYESLFLELSNVSVIVVKTLKDTIKCIQSNQYNIVHYHWWPGIKIIAQYFKVKNIPVVMTLQEQCKPPIYDNVFYVAGSKSNYNYLKDIPEYQKSYIYLGIDVASIEKRKKIVDISQQDFTVGRISTLYPTKIPPNLFEVFSKLHVPSLNFKFIVCGIGDQKYIDQLMLARKKYPNVDISILVDKNVKDKFKKMDIFLYWLPDNESESFGLVIIEAMASGVPVITKNRGAMNEIITNNVNGFLFEDETEIEGYMHKLLLYPELRRKVINNAKKTVYEKFTDKIMSKKYRELYKSIINNKEV